MGIIKRPGIFTRGRIIIDCNIDPSIPEGLKIKEHRKGGELEFYPQELKLELYLTENQKKENWEKGYALKEILNGKPVLNAVLLDFFFANQNLIPECCKDKRSFFWGTDYHDDYGGLYVRYLDCDGGECEMDYFSLDDDWDVNCPAVLLAS